MTKVTRFWLIVGIGVCMIIFLFSDDLELVKGFGAISGCLWILHILLPSNGYEITVNKLRFRLSQAKNYEAVEMLDKTLKENVRKEDDSFYGKQKEILQKTKE